MFKPFGFLLNFVEQVSLKTVGVLRSYVIIVKWLLSKCVVAVELILHVWIVRIELRASELQIVCFFVCLCLRTLGSGINS